MQSLPVDIYTKLRKNTRFSTEEHQLSRLRISALRKSIAQYPQGQDFSVPVTTCHAVPVVCFSSNKAGNIQTVLSYAGIVASGSRPLPSHAFEVSETKSNPSSQRLFISGWGNEPVSTTAMTSSLVADALAVA